MSTVFRFEVDVSSKLKVTVINKDIINVAADAVVTGEGLGLEKESFITKALLQKSPSFKYIRQDLKKCYPGLKLWTVYTSELGIPFRYVIHALLDSSKRSFDWLGDMKTLYRRVFAAAGPLPIRVVAVPLLGAGTAETDAALSIQAIVESVLKFSPKYEIHIKIVNKNANLIGMIIDQLEESRNNYSKKGLFSKIRSKVNDVTGKLSDRLSQPEQNHLPKRRPKNVNRQIVLKENRELEAALRISKEEHERTESVGRKSNGFLGTVPEKSSRRTCYPNTYHSSDDDETKSSFEYGSYNASIYESVYNEMGTTDHPKDSGSDTDLTCPICLSAILVPKQLHKCGHIFCEDCIERSFRDFKPVCPSCMMVYGVITGNQPDGTMDVGFSSQSLPGYPGCGSITITYNIPSGIQQTDHPSPGQPFTGTTRRAYLPDCKEGKAILTLLRIAFDRKLTFTIGRSTTSGRDGVVTWNDIHHKTNMDGGPTRYGYPDPTYLTRVRDELACKGVTEAILSSA